MGDSGIDIAKFLGCIPHLSCQYSPFSLDSTGANSLERLRQRAHYRLRLEQALLSSYALGESHPDSFWMAFEVKAFHPHPYPPPQGGGIYGECWMAFEVWTHSAITAFKYHSEESPVGGKTKNLKPFREVYPFDRTCRRGVRLRLTRSPQVVSLRAGSESAEGLRTTKNLFSMSTKLGRLT